MTEPMATVADLKGKLVLITGASTGISAAAARAFGRNGARVAVHYNASREAAEAVAEDVGAFLYLASEALSGYGTGQNLEVNGGPAAAGGPVTLSASISLRTSTVWSRPTTTPRAPLPHSTTTSSFG